MKPLTDFPTNVKRQDGRGSYCKACMLLRSKASYRKTREAQGKQVREPEMLDEGSKRCKDCGPVKTVDEFPRNKTYPDGRHPYCKPCHNARGKESKDRLYGGTRSYHLKARYGITAAEADELLQEQGGLCALCRELPAEHVDHDHVFGQVRGLLCFNCNGGLGQFRDRVDILQNAIDYLERTSESQWQKTLVSAGAYRLTSPRQEAASPTSLERLHRIFSLSG